MDPGDKNSILFRPIQANFRLNYFSHLHITLKMSTCQSKFVYIMHKLFYFWGSHHFGTCFHPKYFASPMASPGWAAQAHEPTFAPPKSRMSLKSFKGLLTSRPSHKIIELKMFTLCQNSRYRYSVLCKTASNTRYSAQFDNLLNLAAQAHKPRYNRCKILVSLCAPLLAPRWC